MPNTGMGGLREFLAHPVGAGCGSARAALNSQKPSLALPKFRRAGRGSAWVLAQTVDCKVRAVVGACGFCGRLDAARAGRGDCGETEPVHFRARHAKAKTTQNRGWAKKDPRRAGVWIRWRRVVRWFRVAVAACGASTRHQCHRRPRRCRRGGGCRVRGRRFGRRD